jgi:hypothetical protein
VLSDLRGLVAIECHDGDAELQVRRGAGERRERLEPERSGMVIRPH